MKSGTPPHQTYPGVADSEIHWVPIGLFAGAESAASHRFTSTTEYLETIVSIPRLYVGGRILVRVLWSVDTGSTADSVTWRVRYAPISPEADAVTTAATTALETTIADDAALATASALQRSPDGVLNGGDFADGDLIKLRLDMPTLTSLTATTDAIHAYGVELKFTRKEL